MIYDYFIPRKSFSKISHETSGIGNLPNNFPRKEIADKKIGYNLPFKNKNKKIGYNFTQQLDEVKHVHLCQTYSNWAKSHVKTQERFGFSRDVS